MVLVVCFPVCVLCLLYDVCWFDWYGVNSVDLIFYFYLLVVCFAFARWCCYLGSSYFVSGVLVFVGVYRVAWLWIWMLGLFWCVRV